MEATIKLQVHLRLISFHFISTLSSCRHSCRIFADHCESSCNISDLNFHRRALVHSMSGNEIVMIQATFWSFVHRGCSGFLGVNFVTFIEDLHTAISGTTFSASNECVFRLQVAGRKVCIFPRTCTYRSQTCLEVPDEFEYDMQVPANKGGSIFTDLHVSKADTPLSTTPTSVASRGRKNSSRFQQQQEEMDQKRSKSAAGRGKSGSRAGARCVPCRHLRMRSH